jgi:hypothetical protein
MRHRKCKTAWDPVPAESFADSNLDTDTDWGSNYEPCTSSDDSDGDKGCYDGCYSNSTHQAEYTDVSDYEDAATSSESDNSLGASTLAVCTVFFFLITSELFDQDLRFLLGEKTA